MRRRINIDDFPKEMTEILKMYTKDMEQGLEKEKQKAARAGAKELRETSPVGRRGRYAKGWTSTKRGTAYIIRNKTDYQLTHLLEKGHALWQGGRSPAIPHIKPVEEEVIKKYTDGVVKVIRGK